MNLELESFSANNNIYVIIITIIIIIKYYCDPSDRCNLREDLHFKFQ